MTKNPSAGAGARKAVRRHTSGILQKSGRGSSLVEHSLGVRGSGSSNLPVPTNLFPVSSLDWRQSQIPDFLLLGPVKPNPPP